MIFEGWVKECGDGRELFFLPMGSPAWMTEGHTKIWEHETQQSLCKAGAWIEVMTEWHKFNGWEPYRAPW